ncbi:MAG TPA: ABC transporter permease [Candidatus Sulfomarinibacteraceae bacterium]|nr:ABC transporter permease [Candidatus Sulfomarinibacteraceae bacterium]
MHELSPSTERAVAQPTTLQRAQAQFSQRATELTLALMLLLLIAFFASQTPFFFTRANIINLAQTLAPAGIVAIGMTLVLISGGIDISVGSTAALSGVVTSYLWTVSGVPLLLSTILGLGSGLLVGFLNGFFITYLKVNPLITTLGTFSIIRGAAFIISSGQTNQLNNDAFKYLGRGAIFGVPFSLILMLSLFVLFAFILRHTHFGRRIYAIGGSPEASRLSGIAINRTLMSVYLISGLLAGAGGLLIASQLASSAPRAAIGLELTVIAAVVLGGTGLSGGKGSLLGTLVGVLILRILDNGLILMNVSSFYQQVASGAVLLLAVGFDQLRTRLEERAS